MISLWKLKPLYAPENRREKLEYFIHEIDKILDYCHDERMILLAFGFMDRVKNRLIADYSHKKKEKSCC